MTNSYRVLAGGMVAALILGCGDDPTEPGPVPSSVTVTSAIDTLVPQSVNTQLTATARNQAGAPIAGAQFAWASSNDAVATVGASGLVTPQAAGTVTITATTSGLGAVSGSLRLRVVATDLPTVGTLSNDVFPTALVGQVSAGQRPAVQAAWNACGAGASTGNVVMILNCVTQMRAAAAAAADPTDRAVLAVALLFVEEIERRLRL